MSLIGKEGKTTLRATAPTFLPFSPAQSSQPQQHHYHHPEPERGVASSSSSSSSRNGPESIRNGAMARNSRRNRSSKSKNHVQHSSRKQNVDASLSQEKSNNHQATRKETSHKPNKGNERGKNQHQRARDLSKRSKQPSDNNTSHSKRHGRRKNNKKNQNESSRPGEKSRREQNVGGEEMSGFIDAVTADSFEPSFSVTPDFAKDGAAFPHLLQSSSFSTPRESLHTIDDGEKNDTCWSESKLLAIKQNLQATEEKEPENNQSQEEGLNTSFGNIGLTLLSNTRKKISMFQQNSALSTRPPTTDIEERQREVVENTANLSSEKTQHSVDSFALPRRQRRLDMTRLRDRWWDLMEKRPPRPETPPSQDSGEEDLSESSEANSLAPIGNHCCLVSTKMVPSLPSFYLEDYSDPIHEAIRRNDESALRALLKMSDSQQWLSKAEEDVFSPITLSVHLSRPEMLRILLGDMSYCRTGHASSSSSSSCYGSALQMAVLRGNTDIVRVFLDFSPSYMLIREEDTENNSLHLACTRDASSEVLPLCLKHMDNAVTTKAMSQKNKRGQTPLHIACASGRVDFVEMILSSCTYSLLSKVLSAQDSEWQTPLLSAVASGSVDVVMSLLMWKGNNQKIIQEVVAKGQCALTWAVRARDVEMALLLLEFNNSQGQQASGYNLDHALYTAVRMVERNTVPCDSVQLELVRVLIASGANPYSADAPTGEASLLAAVEAHREELVQVMVNSFDKYLSDLQGSRRRDPFLQKQPDSFFRNLEQQEDFERATAIRQALVTSLFHGWTKSDLSEHFYSCALVLYKSGVDVDTNSLERLKHALHFLEKAELTSAEICAPTSESFEASYCHLSGTSNQTKQMATKEPEPSSYWSVVMAQASWVDCSPCSPTSCKWLQSLREREYESFDEPQCDLELVSAEGDSFFVHSVAVSAKSAKIDAAVRFEMMSKGDDENTTIRLDIPLPSELCKWILQHIYHGSIIGPFPSCDRRLSDLIIQILEFAEHHLCPSLAQEAEMRLLSCQPRSCCCCQCSFYSRDRKEISYVSRRPSKCIRPDTVLEILAVCLQFSVQGNGLEYTIRGSRDELTRPSWMAPDNIPCGVFQAVQQLQLACSEYIVCNFKTVFQTESFNLYFEPQPATTLPEREPFAFLLQTCLDNLVSLPLLSNRCPRPLPTNVAFTSKVNC